VKRPDRSCQISDQTLPTPPDWSVASKILIRPTRDDAASLNFQWTALLCDTVYVRVYACLNADLQETSRLFEDIKKVVDENTPERKILIRMFSECGVVELVRKILQKYVNGELRQQNKDLPRHVETSLKVSILTVLLYSTRRRNRCVAFYVK